MGGGGLMPQHNDSKTFSLPLRYISGAEILSGSWDYIF